MFVVCFCYFWIRKLSSATGIEKNRSTSGNNKNFKKTKTPKDFQECLGPGFSFFRAFDFFWCFSFSFYSTFFLVFGFGSFHPLLGLQKTRNPSGKQKTKGFKGMSGPRTFFKGFVFFDFGGRPHHSENKRILLLTVSLCSCFLPPSPKNLKSSS